eukprot:TRINITY_DN4884_c0_g3_i2.p1 TRINITY_DN4884_c0_g3~~TRINITY_DN4884_c0_g3_i2.p1  ORF type:complete len:405 (-),score=66.84 TRINITY_DN4884_c0_g3_i2:48-1118(-)
MSTDEMDAKQENDHFLKVIDAFAYYWDYSIQRLERAKDNFSALSDRHKSLLPTMGKKFEDWNKAIETNADFFETILSYKIFVDTQDDDIPPRGSRNRASAFNMDKVNSTLRQFHREWSAEGAEERQKSYGIIMEELERIYPVTTDNQYTVRVLCPGSGLGRLPFDICKRGYCCQGNEYSYFMLIAGNFMLNITDKVGQHTIYPFVHQISNNVHTDDQFASITIPDVLPSSLPPNADFSYAAGDFVEIYGQQSEAWDCVVTCFFMDTANNILQFVDIIHKILKPGGWWLNLGPLLYHYADMMHEQSIEISYEQLAHAVNNSGFEITKESWHETPYTCNPKSMMKYVYKTVFFAAQKK